MQSEKIMIEIQAQEEFIVTARKWRPLKFDSVVGQDHITGTLRNAINSNRIHHAYLFCGPRGVGKTTTARILARAVNCLAPEGAEPCNKCTNCTSTLAGRSLDIIEIDGASNNSVDDIRKLRENARYQPSLGKYKMYIIDEVHMLSTSAFNALLKILEEPPSHLLFVFATTESHKVPATIISRCQRFDFKRMEIADIVRQLKFIADNEQMQIDEESLVTIAKKGDGSMRDSQSIFDQVRAFCGNNIVYTEMASALHLIDEDFYFKITDAIAEKSAAKILELAAEVISRGYELQETLQGLLEHFRNILTVVVTNDTKLINTSTVFLAKYREAATKFTKANLLRYLQIINSTEQALKYMPQPRIRFEIALVSMAELDTAADIKELIEEVRSLKSGVPLPKTAGNIATNSLITTPAKEASGAPIIKEMPASSIAMPPPPKHEQSVTNKVVQAEDGATKSNKVTANDLRNGWKMFYKKIVKIEPTLNVLDNVVPDFFPNEIILKSNNNFVVDIIIKSKDVLTEQAAIYFNGSIKISAVIVEESQATRKTQFAEQLASNDFDINNDEHQNSEDNSTQPMPVDESSFEGKHPIEVKLMKNFNAMEVR